MFMTPRPPDFEQDSSHKGNIQQDAYAFLVSVVRDAMEKGAFRQELTDPELVAQVLWSAVHGLIALHLVGAKDKWLDWRPLDVAAPAGLDALYVCVLRKGGVIRDLASKNLLQDELRFRSTTFGVAF